MPILGTYTYNVGGCLRVMNIVNDWRSLSVLNPIFKPSSVSGLTLDFILTDEQFIGSTCMYLQERARIAYTV